MAKSVVVTTTNYQHLRKVNTVTAAVTGTSLPEWTSVTDDGRNTFETVVAVASPVVGLKTVVIPNYSTGPTLAPHRYWRINITAINTVAHTVASFTEIQMHTGTNGFGTDAFVSGTASADSVNSGVYVAAGAVDDLLYDDAASKCWASTNTAFPHWWEYDFGAAGAVDVFGVSIVARSGVDNLDAPKDFTVQYSDDNSAWTTKWTVTGATFSILEFKTFRASNAVTYTGSPHGAHQHWRIRMLLDNGGNICSAEEIEMRATPGGADQCNGGTALSDGNWTGHLDSWAFDNSNATFFGSTFTNTGSNVAYIGYSFPSPVSVAQIAWRNTTDTGQTPKTLFVQYADSASGPWTIAWGVFSSTSWTAEETRLFTDPNYTTSPSTEASAFLARTTGLDATHTSAYTALINGLVIDGIWSKLDLLQIYATQDATTALLNLVSASYPATLVGSPTFTADRGYTGTLDSSIYVDMGFNPVTATSPKYTLNSAHMSAWSVVDLAIARPIMGSLINPTESSLYPRFTDNTAYFRLSDNGAYGSVAVANGVGHYIANRPDSATGEGYKNGSQIKTGADASTSLGNQNFYALGYHYSAGGGTGSSHQCAMTSMGSSLTASDATNFYNRLRTYMTAVGVP